MTGRSAAIQGGLAALGLIAAHFTWQREPERAAGAVAIVEASKSDVGKVRYEDDNVAVELTPGRGGGGPKVWLHLVTKPKTDAPKDPTKDKKDDKKDDKKAQDKNADGKKTEPTKTAESTPAKTPEKPKTPPPRDLPGGDGAAKLYDQFAPFISPRAFGNLEASKLKELGLDAPKRKLEITVKGDVRRYEIGQPANAPGGESFVRDTRDGRVYLMPRTMLTELQNATHLVDRRLHVFELADFDRIVLSSGGKQKEYLQVGRENRATAGFAPPKAPDKRDQMAKNWHDSLWRTFPSDVLGRGEEPASGKPVPALRVDYYEGKRAVGWIEVAKVETGSGMSDEGAANPATEYYARTEHTAGWVKLHSAANTISDAQKLISAP